MTDEKLDIFLNNALKPSNLPDNDVNRSLMDKIRSLNEADSELKDGKNSEERDRWSSVKI